LIEQLITTLRNIPEQRIFFLYGQVIQVFVCRLSDLPPEAQQRVPSLEEQKDLNQNKNVEKIFWENIHNITSQNGFRSTVINTLIEARRRNLFEEDVVDILAQKIQNIDIHSSSK
jgi:hypothetical protein